MSEALTQPAEEMSEADAPAISATGGPDFSKANSAPAEATIETAGTLPFLAEAPPIWTPQPRRLVADATTIPTATVLKSGATLPPEIDDLMSPGVRAMLVLATAPEQKMARVRRRVVAYLRYSTSSQRPESLARQEELLRIFAEMNDLEIVKFYVDAAVSGTIRHRKGLDGALDFIMEGGADGLLVEDCDRLARRFTIIPVIYEQLTLARKQLWDRRHGIIDSELKAAIVAAMASGDYRKLRERLAIGRRKLVEGGGMATCAFGYDIVPGQPGCREINDVKAEIVREIYRLFVWENKSYFQIAKALNERSIASPRGKKWRPKTVATILSTPTYKGLYIFGRKDEGNGEDELQAFDTVIVKMPTMKIVDVDLWNEAEERRLSMTPSVRQKEITERAQTTKRAYATIDYLSRKVFCEVCSQVMWQNSFAGHPDRKVYRCLGSDYKRCHPTLHASEIREGVMDGIKTLVCVPEHEELLSKYWIEGLKQREMELKRLYAQTKAQLEDVEAEILASWASDWMEGYSNELKTGRRRYLEATCNTLKAERDRANSQLRGFRAQEVRRQSVIDKLKIVAEAGHPKKGAPKLAETMAAISSILRSVRVRYHPERNMFDLTFQFCPNGDSDSPTPTIITTKRQVWPLRGRVSDAYLEIVRQHREEGRWSLTEEEFGDLVRCSSALQRAGQVPLARRKAMVEALLCCNETGINVGRLPDLGGPEHNLTDSLYARFRDRGGREQLKDWLSRNISRKSLRPRDNFLPSGNMVAFLLPL